MAYIPPEQAGAGREMLIDIRGKNTQARQVPLPFYKRAKK